MTTPDFTLLEAVRLRRPLVHCISNIVTANDCANLALAVGASPVMAQAPEEMAALAAASAAAVLNTGTPSEETFRACLLCGRETARRGHPVILDPVGVGASPWRLERVEALLAAFTPSLLRVNLGEAQALLGLESREQGVDSPGGEGDSLPRRGEIARRLARETGTAVLLSGPEDVASDGTALWNISGGSARMTLVTGTGCMLSVLCGVFAAVERDSLAAAVAAAAFWKVCSRRAEALARGPGSFRAALLDAAGTLTAADCAREARIQRL